MNSAGDSCEISAKVQASTGSNSGYSFTYAWWETDPIVELTAQLLVNGAVVQSSTNQGQSSLEYPNSNPSESVVVTATMACNDDFFECHYNGIALEMTTTDLTGLSMTTTCP